LAAKRYPSLPNCLGGGAKASHNSVCCLEFAMPAR
jgi:hypothetical protein